MTRHQVDLDGITILKTDFLNSLRSAASTESLNKLNTSIPGCSENHEIDQCLSDFVNIIEHAASPIFKDSNKHKDAKQLFTNNNISENPWFDERCVEKKHYFLHMLDKYRESKSEINRIGLVKARSEYKCLIRKCRF